MNVTNSNNEKSPISRIQNPSGEWEQEARGRLWNFLEPVIMMSVLQILIWGVWFPLELQGKDPIVAFIIMGVMALFILLISPSLHKDTSSSWGLGDPRYIINRMRKGTTKNRILALVVVIIIVVLTVLAIYFFWYEVANFFVDIDPVQAAQFQATLTGKTIIIAAGVILGLFMAFLIIRYDNFLKALKVALMVIAILGTLLFLYSITVAVGIYIDFDLVDFSSGFFAYIFWGALQQLLFASYFGTRFRKAFSPANGSNSEDTPKLWKKRLLVSIISGSYFGLIHVPSWYLLIFTTVLGVVISWLYMKDRNRNLIAIGVIHGFLGSLIGVFFASGVVEMTVGPSSVPVELVPDFWIVGIFLIIQQVIIVVVWFLLEYRKNKT